MCTALSVIYFYLFYFYFSKLFLEGSSRHRTEAKLLKWILVRFMKSVGKEREKASVYLYWIVIGSDELIKLLFL